MDFKQQQIDTIFKLKHEKKIAKDLNRLFKIIIDDIVNYYTKYNTYKNLNTYKSQLNAIFFMNWIEVSNKFINIINKMLINTNTNELLKNIASQSFNNITYKNLLEIIKNKTMQINNISMQNIVEQTSTSIINTNNKKFYELSLLGLSAELFKKEITNSYKNRIDTISTTFTQMSSETTKSNYTNLINDTITEDLPENKLTKTWGAVLDNHTREAHAEADGQTVNVNDFFVVWGELLSYPGDTKYSTLKNTIQCRCSSMINF